MECWYVASEPGLTRSERNVSCMEWYILHMLGVDMVSYGNGELVNGL